MSANDAAIQCEEEMRSFQGSTDDMEMEFLEDERETSMDVIANRRHTVDSVVVSSVGRLLLSHTLLLHSTGFLVPFLSLLSSLSSFSFVFDVSIGDFAEIVFFSSLMMFPSRMAMCH